MVDWYKSSGWMNLKNHLKKKNHPEKFFLCSFWKHISVYVKKQNIKDSQECTKPTGNDATLTVKKCLPIQSPQTITERTIFWKSAPWPEFFQSSIFSDPKCHLCVDVDWEATSRFSVLTRWFQFHTKEKLTNQVINNSLRITWRGIWCSVTALLPWWKKLSDGSWSREINIIYIL